MSNPNIANVDPDFPKEWGKLADGTICDIPLPGEFRALRLRLVALTEYAERLRAALEITREQLMLLSTIYRFNKGDSDANREIATMGEKALSSIPADFVEIAKAKREKLNYLIETFNQRGYGRESDYAAKSLGYYLMHDALQLAQEREGVKG